MTECETHHEELVDGECESCEWEEHKKKEEREFDEWSPRALGAFIACQSLKIEPPAFPDGMTAYVLRLGSGRLGECAESCKEFVKQAQPLIEAKEKERTDTAKNKIKGEDMEPNLLSVFEKLFPKLRNEPNANKVLDYLVALPGNQGLAGLEILCDILDIKVDANLGEYNVNQEVKAEIREKLSDLLKQSL